MPPRADLSFVGLDDAVFKFAISETVTSVNEIETSTSKTSKESLEKPKTIRPSDPIIEEWESDTEDENVVEKTEVKKTVKPSLEKIKFVNARNTTVENESKAEKPVRKPVKQVNTARPKAVISAVRTNRVNDVQALACWVWRPIKPNSSSITLKIYDYFDVKGRSRVIEGVVQPVAPTTAEQMLTRKNELKARGTLLMALPNKHQLKFNIHKDAKTLMEAIEKRFGGNKKTKKVQKTLLKQQYENFTGSSSESLDQIHDRLQKFISQLEILGETLSQEDINLKFLRSLPTEWRTHTLIRRNKTDLDEQSLDDLFNSLKIYEAEVKSSTSANTFTQNIAFVSFQNTDITNEPVSAVASVSTADAKIPVSALPNVDTLSNVVIYSFFASQSNSSQLDNDDLKQIDRTRRNLGANGPTSMGFDMSKVECYNCHMKGHFARECRSPKDTRKNVAAEPQRRNVLVETSTSNALVSQCDGVGSYDWSFQAEEEPTNYALMTFTSSSSSSSDNKLKDNALVVLRQKFEKAEQERDDLKLKLEKFQTSLKNLSQLLASQTNDKTGLGYNTQVFTSSMFDCDEMFTSESDESLPPSPIYDRPSTPIIEDWVSDSEDDSEPELTQNVPSFVQPNDQVKTLRPSVKPVETFIPAVNPNIDISKPKSHGNSRNRKACFVLLTKSKLVPITAARPVTAAVPKPHVTRPRQAKTIVTKPHSPPRRHINRSPSPKASNFPPKVTAVKVPQVNAIKGGKISEKGKIRTRKLDFDDVYFVKELKFNLFSFSQMCDKKNGVLFTDTKCIVLSPEFKLLDENQVMLRVPRENNTYNVDLKNIVYSGDLTCLFAKATLDETLIEAAKTMLADSLLSISFWAEAVNTACYVQNKVLVTKPQNKTPYELLLGRTPSIGFMRPVGCLVTILNTLDPLGKFDRKVDEGFLVGYTVSSKAFSVFNSRTRIVQETLHIIFLENKPNVAGSGPIWLFDIDTLTKTMNYQPVTADNQFNPSAGVQEFDAEKEPEFEERKPESEVHVSPGSSTQTKKHDDNCINELNAADSPVPAVRKISTNNTYTFSAVEFEDITYSNDEEDVGAKADFTNLETSITVSHIPTTRVHKDHHVTQIIGDLSSATQTRSMTKVAKDQGFEDPDYSDKVYKVVNALYGLHQAPKAWYETLVNYLLENDFQKGKIDHTLFIKRKKCDILLVQIYVDDIIFGSTNKDLCKAFERLTKYKFQMSSMGEITFFLGLQVKQKQDGIFISQDKYVAEILRKFGLTDGKSASTPIDTEKPYLITQKVSHLHAVKRIFRYLKGKPHLGLWYPKDSPINLVAYSDSDYAGASLDRKSTTWVVNSLDAD
nr:hypothetical protein [Tanacetum cinerariifolium]